MTNAPSIPRLAFLGVCDRVNKVRNVLTGLQSYNLLNLRNEIVSNFFPLPLSGLHMVFALFDPTASNVPAIVCDSNSRGHLFRLDLKTVSLVPEEIPPDPRSFQEFHVPTYSPWLVVPLPFPEINSVALSPDLFHFYAVDEKNKFPIGGLALYYQQPAPLNQERIAAIRSDPYASKAARMHFSCNSCRDTLKVYTGIERSKDAEKEGYMWYADLGDQFKCKCGANQIDLAMLRSGFHAVLGKRFATEGHEISVSRLYQKASLQGIYDSFERLLKSDPEESEFQSFFEQNPILFHIFTPARIIKKAQILNKFETDFAVLSETGQLFLVEIEKSGKPLLTKKGRRTAKFNEPFDQVHDWLDLITSHRITCLEMMDIKPNVVSRIRGVVIIGREEGLSKSQISKLKSTDFGEVVFFTYDDILDSLASLIREIESI